MVDEGCILDCDREWALGQTSQVVLGISNRERGAHAIRLGVFIHNVPEFML